MRPYGILCAGLLSMAACSVQAVDDTGRDMLECKLTLPNGDLYMRGATDPVAELTASLTLTNKTEKENRGKVSVTVRRGAFITVEEQKKFESMEFKAETSEEYEKQLKASMKEFADSKLVSKTIEVTPVNPKSQGLAYVPLELGPHDLVEFIIKKVPDEGAAGADQAKAKPVARHMPVEHTGRMDVVATKYLAASETTEPFLLPVGKFYNIREPGTYSIKAVLRGMGDSKQADRVVESNEERFRVLPYKIVDKKIESLTEWWEDYERGHPDFHYMLYQLARAEPYQEIYYVQRIIARGMERWEWHRLCTVAPNTKVQVAQVTPTKVAVLAQHYKGDAGLYTLDFAKIDTAVTAQTMPLKDGKAPTLKVEGGNVSSE